MARTVPSLISRWRGTLAILCNAGLNQMLWAAPSRYKRNHRAADGVPIPRVSCFRDFDYLADGLWGKTFFCKLALALQRQFERVRKIRFGLFDGFALRNRGRNLFHKAGIATLFGGVKNGCQFHASRLSHPAIALVAAAGERLGGPRQRRHELAGGEGIEGAEAGGEVGGGPAALAGEAAGKNIGPLFSFPAVHFLQPE